MVDAYVFTYCVYESEIFLSKNNFMMYFSTFEQKFYSFNLIVIYRTRAQPCFILPPFNPYRSAGSIRRAQKAQII